MERRYMLKRRNGKRKERSQKKRDSKKEERIQRKGRGKKKRHKQQWEGRRDKGKEGKIYMR